MKPLDPQVGISKELLEATTYHVAVRAREAKPAIQFMKPLAGRYDGLPQLGEDPALLVRSVGKGRAIYFSGDLGNSIQTFHLASHLEMLKSWFASPVTLSNAPGSVEIVLRSQEGGKRWLLHLINATGEMTRPIRNIVPIHDIKVTLPKERRVHQITAVRSGARIAAGPTFMLPVLNDYELVVTE